MIAFILISLLFISSDIILAIYKSKGFIKEVELVINILIIIMVVIVIVVIAINLIKLYKLRSK